MLHWAPDWHSRAFRAGEASSSPQVARKSAPARSDPGNTADGLTAEEGKRLFCQKLSLNFEITTSITSDSVPLISIMVDDGELDQSMSLLWRFGAGLGRNLHLFMKLTLTSLTTILPIIETQSWSISISFSVLLRGSGIHLPGFFFGVIGYLVGIGAWELVGLEGYCKCFMMP